MAERFYGRAFAAVPSGLRWRQWLQAYGHAFRTVLLAHRDSAQLCAIAAPSTNAREATELLAQPLVNAGLTRAAGVVLVDYKTDRVTPETLPGRAAFYDGQMRLYRGC